MDESRVLPCPAAEGLTMWQCIKCHEEVEEEFEICWSCGTSRDGAEDPEFRRVDDVAAAALAEAAAEQQAAAIGPREQNPILCLRCNRKLDFVGTKKFHEGTRAWDFMGGMWELFKNREHFDVYVCPRCGRVEFFLDGVGEEFRPG